MAEQEVIKHTKKVYKIWTSKEHSFWQKVKEFLLEVFIIVFAITLSIWFHNRSEHAQQQEDVEHFLLGLKSDLKSDLAEMNDDKQAYLLQMAAFSYITSVKLNQQLNRDSLAKYGNSITNTTAFSPNDGRFEGFKSSGKIGFIENDELQNDIMDFYQENIVSLLASTAGYLDTKKSLFEFIIKNRKRLTDTSTNINTILAEDEAQNICTALKTPYQLLSRYDSCINKADKIIREINEEYHVTK